MLSHRYQNDVLEEGDHQQDVQTARLCVNLQTLLVVSGANGYLTSRSANKAPLAAAKLRGTPRMHRFVDAAARVTLITRTRCGDTWDST